MQSPLNFLFTINNSALRSMTKLTSVRSIIMSLAAIVLLCSCQKVISIDLAGTTPQYVIVGAITNQPGVYQVSITQTKNFNNDNNFPGVSKATVTIEHNGTLTPLPETSSGIYQTTALTG